jgi:hypothetical protein
MSEKHLAFAALPEVFFLDIPFYRTFPPPRRLRGEDEVPLKPASYGIRILRARSLVTHGFTVLVGSRSFERGEAAAKEVGPDAPRPPTRRDGSGVDYRRGEARPEGIRPPQRAHTECGDLEYEQTARPDRR